MGKNKKGQGMASENRTSTIIIAAVALAAGLFLGGVLIPALKESTTPATTAGGTGFAQQIVETQRQLESQPDSADLWARLGNLYFDTDQHSKAIDAYKKSLALKPGDAHVLTDLGVMYRRNGNPQKAVESFDKAILAAPDHETARFNKGIVQYYDLKDKAAAIQTWNGLVQMNPGAKTPSGKLIKDMIRDLQ
ncbi:tetratricopeptide repeat protein [Maridesulfovibrio sp.]|uniref:tetratricopeptide repeat protein n=1 Tax=Maridesulfovibrio sp. TaxID=2795000 RepID=UPI0029C9D1C6|nr:tetratricopeptide repeat protein [Maridesulfovibrio sp.]